MANPVLVKPRVVRSSKTDIAGLSLFWMPQAPW